MKKLTKLRDAEAEKFYKDSGWVPSEWAVMNFKAGFDCRDKLDKEALKIAVEALNEIAIEQQFYIAKKDYFSEVVRLNLTAKEALEEIRKLRGE